MVFQKRGSGSLPGGSPALVNAAARNEKTVRVCERLRGKHRVLKARLME
jgi:hypothetical protein